MNLNMVTSIPEAKLKIKQLKLKKKELNLIKKEINQQQKQIRAEYTDAIRKQGSKFRGGGKIGKFIRNVQTFSRDAQRRALAEALEPLEQKKQIVQSSIHEIEYTILQLEAYIIENS